MPKRHLYSSPEQPSHSGRRKVRGNDAETSFTMPQTERQQLAYLLSLTANEMKCETTEGPEVLANETKKRCRDKLSSINKPKNKSGETQLHLCATKGDLDITKSLVRKGADVNCRDNAGWTPLHEACNHGHYKVAKFLLRAGAEVNAQGFDGDTPLHDASSNGHLEIVLLLLRHGGNPHQKNDKGRTPIDVADSDRVLKAQKNFTKDMLSDLKPIKDMEIKESIKTSPVKDKELWPFQKLKRFSNIDDFLDVDDFDQYSTSETRRKHSENSTTCPATLDLQHKAETKLDNCLSIDDLNPSITQICYLHNEEKKLASAINSSLSQTVKLTDLTFIKDNTLKPHKKKRSSLSSSSAKSAGYESEEARKIKKRTDSLTCLLPKTDCDDKKPECTSGNRVTEHMFKNTSEQIKNSGLFLDFTENDKIRDHSAVIALNNSDCLTSNHLKNHGKIDEKEKSKKRLLRLKAFLDDSDESNNEHFISDESSLLIYNKFQSCQTDDSIIKGDYEKHKKTVIQGESEKINFQDEQVKSNIESSKIKKPKNKFLKFLKLSKKDKCVKILNNNKETNERSNVFNNSEFKKKDFPLLTSNLFDDKEKKFQVNSIFSEQIKNKYDAGTRNQSNTVSNLKEISNVSESEDFITDLKNKCDSMLVQPINQLAVVEKFKETLPEKKSKHLYKALHKSICAEREEICNTKIYQTISDAKFSEIPNAKNSVDVEVSEKKKYITEHDMHHLHQKYSQTISSEQITEDTTLKKVIPEVIEPMKSKCVDELKVGMHENNLTVNELPSNQKKVSDELPTLEENSILSAQKNVLINQRLHSLNEVKNSILFLLKEKDIKNSNLFYQNSETLEKSCQNSSSVNTLSSNNTINELCGFEQNIVLQDTQVGKVESPCVHSQNCNLDYDKSQNIRIELGYTEDKSQNSEKACIETECTKVKLTNYDNKTNENSYMAELFSEKIEISTLTKILVPSINAEKVLTDKIKSESLDIEQPQYPDHSLNLLGSNLKPMVSKVINIDDSYSKLSTKETKPVVGCNSMKDLVLVKDEYSEFSFDQTQKNDLKQTKQLESNNALEKCDLTDKVVFADSISKQKRKENFTLESCSFIIPDFKADLHSKNEREIKTSKGVLKELSKDMKVSKDIPKETSKETKLNKDIPEETSKETKLNKDIPKETSKETKLNKDIPKETSKETKLNKDIPKETSKETKLNKDIPKDTSQETKLNKDIPKEISKETKLNKDIPKETYKEINVNKDTLKETKLNKDITKETSKEINANKDIPKETSKETKLNKDILKETSKETKLNKDIPKETSKETKLNKDIPKEINVNKDTPKETKQNKVIPKEINVNKDTPKETKLNKDIPKEISKETKINKDIPKETSKEINANKDILKETSKETKINKDLPKETCKEVKTNKSSTKETSKEINKHKISNFSSESNIDKEKAVKFISPVKHFEDKILELDLSKSFALNMVPTRKHHKIELPKSVIIHEHILECRPKLEKFQKKHSEKELKRKHSFTTTSTVKVAKLDLNQTVLNLKEINKLIADAVEPSIALDEDKFVSSKTEQVVEKLESTCILSVNFKKTKAKKEATQHCFNHESPSRQVFDTELDNESLAKALTEDSQDENKSSLLEMLNKCKTLHPTTKQHYGNDKQHDFNNRLHNVNNKQHMVNDKQHNVNDKQHNVNDKQHASVKYSELSNKISELPLCHEELLQPKLLNSESLQQKIELKFDVIETTPTLKIESAIKPDKNKNELDEVQNKKDPAKPDEIKKETVKFDEMQNKNLKTSEKNKSEDCLAKDFAKCLGNQTSFPVNDDLLSKKHKFECNERFRKDEDSVSESKSVLKGSTMCKTTNTGLCNSSTMSNKNTSILKSKEGSLKLKEFDINIGMGITALKELEEANRRKRKQMLAKHKDTKDVKNAIKEPNKEIRNIAKEVSKSDELFKKVSKNDFDHNNKLLKTSSFFNSNQKLKTFEVAQKSFVSESSTMKCIDSLLKKTESNKVNTVTAVEHLMAKQEDNKTSNKNKKSFEQDSIRTTSVSNTFEHKNIFVNTLTGFKTDVKTFYDNKELNESESSIENENAVGNLLSIDDSIDQETIFKTSFDAVGEIKSNLRNTLNFQNYPTIDAFSSNTEPSSFKLGRCAQMQKTLVPVAEVKAAKEDNYLPNKSNYCTESTAKDFNLNIKARNTSLESLKVTTSLQDFLITENDGFPPNSSTNLTTFRAPQITGNEQTKNQSIENSKSSIHLVEEFRILQTPQSVLPENEIISKVGDCILEMDTTGHTYTMREFVPVTSANSFSFFHNLRLGLESCTTLHFSSDIKSKETLLSSTKSEPNNEPPFSGMVTNSLKNVVPSLSNLITNSMQNNASSPTSMVTDSLQNSIPSFFSLDASRQHNMPDQTRVTETSNSKAPSLNAFSSNEFSNLSASFSNELNQLNSTLSSEIVRASTSSDEVFLTLNDDSNQLTVFSTDVFQHITGNVNNNFNQQKCLMDPTVVTSESHSQPNQFGSVKKFTSMSSKLDEKLYPLSYLSGSDPLLAYQEGQKINFRQNLSTSKNSSSFKEILLPVPVNRDIEMENPDEIQKVAFSSWRQVMKANCLQLNRSSVSSSIGFQILENFQISSHEEIIKKAGNNEKLKDLLLKHASEEEKLRLSLLQEISRVECNCKLQKEGKGLASVSLALYYQNDDLTNSLDTTLSFRHKSSHLPDMDKLLAARLDALKDKYQVLKVSLLSRHQLEKDTLSQTQRFETQLSYKEILRQRYLHPHGKVF